MFKHYMKPDSNTPPAYSYCVGEDTDVLWNSKTCIEVEPRPTTNHVYNMKTKAWELNEDYYMDELRGQRNMDLALTDKFMLSDYPISEEDKALIETYRQALRDAPNKELLADRVLPECPEICG